MGGRGGRGRGRGASGSGNGRTGGGSVGGPAAQYRRQLHTRRELGEEEETAPTREDDTWGIGGSERGDFTRAAKFPIPLSMWDFGQCDARRCTGKKLERFGWIKGLKPSQRCRGNAIVLTPDGKQSVVSVSFVAFKCKMLHTLHYIAKHKVNLQCPNDRDIIQSDGICVVDCSWNKVDTYIFLFSTSPDILQYFLFLSAHFFICAVCAYSSRTPYLLSTIL